MTEMEPSSLLTTLHGLMSLPSELEWFEFKAVRGSSFSVNEIGEYFSALSNEANLKKQNAGWLVFGVTDRPPRKIVGTHYGSDGSSLEKVKQSIAENTGGISFREIHALTIGGQRVLMFEIPPAPKGIPTPWKGHYYGRNGESIGALSLDEIERIRAQASHEDWSEGICPNATANDLDPAAVAFARQQYKRKNHHLAGEVDRWDTHTFLNKTRMRVGGRLTRAAIVLLGNSEAGTHISPSVAHITWTLKSASGAYEHFGPPLLLAVDRVFAKIRNLTYRYLPNESLFPVEITQYDPWVIRETLHNCIAHQDYTKCGRINVVEEPDSLLFTNLGTFLPGSVEAVIRRDAPPEIYRNPLLADIMVKLNMIDTIGSGIRRMFFTLRDRHFPLPDYDLSEPDRVKVRIQGKIIDENYTRILAARPELDMMDVIALDKVQKRQPLNDGEFRSLKAKKLVEGRRPNLFVSAEIAAATDTRAEYIKRRAFDKAHYKNMILQYLGKFGEASRTDLDKLLAGKLSDALSAAQKKTFIRNLLQEMRRDSTIKRVGAKRGARWVLSTPSSDD